MQPELKLLKAYVKNGGSLPALASKFRYKSSATLTAWIRRGRIPNYMVERVRKEVTK